MRFEIAKRTQPPVPLQVIIDCDGDQHGARPARREWTATNYAAMYRDAERDGWVYLPSTGEWLCPRCSGHAP